MEYLARRAIFFITIIAGFSKVCVSSSVHKVGDAVGWTTIGNFDYRNWAAARVFHVHDTIVFQYDPQNHNVMQVSLPDYRSCNTNSPMVIHSTGNDSIVIQSPGHYYFVCGFPGHCLGGLKLDIRVPKFPN
ncbi:hypothetical protein M9H77_13848 [Catharanthus roseus]|uniref:Uncharacterized protein n=1 Tax=Catharanthus roseus TaxID=4058 RepID=A0ACC0BLK8_CATRO|nr:hypothetical protein M9H77_13848 [Catharanthus roseus]